MEQIKDIFKQVRQAKGSLAFCKEEIINDTLYALADRVEVKHGPDSGRERQGSGGDGSVESQI